MQGLKFEILEPSKEVGLFWVLFLLGRDLGDGTMNGPEESYGVCVCVFVCVCVCVCMCVCVCLNERFMLLLEEARKRKNGRKTYR